MFLFFPVIVKNISFTQIYLKLSQKYYIRNIILVILFNSSMLYCFLFKIKHLNTL